MSRTASQNWLGEPDAERRDLIQRALNVSGAGSVLLQTFINRVVQSLTLRELGLQAVLDRKPGSGNAAYINRRTAGSTGGAWVADTDSSTEETGTYAQTSFTYRTLLTKGKVTRKLQATGRSYGDTLAEELAGKAGDFAELLEAGLITGDTNASSNQINGLLTLINNVSGQVIANSTAGDDLVLAKLDETIDQVKGSDNPADLILLCSKIGSRKLNAALQSQQQFTNVVEIAAGFRVRTYDGIPIVKSTEMPAATSPPSRRVLLPASLRSIAVTSGSRNSPPRPFSRWPRLRASMMNSKSTGMALSSCRTPLELLCSPISRLPDLPLAGSLGGPVGIHEARFHWRAAAYMLTSPVTPQRFQHGSKAHPS